MAMRERYLDPPQRSIDSVSARRTRASSKGLRLWLGVTMRLQFQSLSWTVSLSPSAFLEIVTRLGRKSAEFDSRAVAANGLEANGHLGRGNRPVAVEIGFSLVVVFDVALALDERARLVLHEREGARAVHVLLVPSVAVLVEVGLRVDEVIRQRKRRNEGARRVFQLEDQRPGVRCGLTDFTMLKNALRLLSMPFGGLMILS